MQEAAFHTPYLHGIRPDVSGGPKHRPAEAQDISFDDVIDAVNPLHHLPGVSTLYRDMTGDTIKAPMKVIGGALIGGPLGLLGAIADVVLEEVTGRDFGGHVMAMFRGDDGKASPGAVQVAEDKASVTIDVVSARPGPDVQSARVDLSSVAPAPPSSLRQAAQEEELDLPSAPVQPVQLSALDTASGHQGSQIPRELMESLYRMHQDQYMQMMQSGAADRQF